MSTPIKITWPAPDTQAVCLNQTMPTAGYLKINGTLSSDPRFYPTFAEFPGFVRQITLTSTGDLSGVNFKITGLDDAGFSHSYDTPGPNINTITTFGTIFSKITSIYANSAFASNISVGMGTVGATRWVLSDYQRSENNLSVAVFVNYPAITYTFQTSLADMSIDLGGDIIFPIDGITIPTIPAKAGMQHVTETVIANYNIPTRYSRIYINGGDATGTLTAYFLQQGLT